MLHMHAASHGCIAKQRMEAALSTRYAAPANARPGGGPSIMSSAQPL